MIPYIANTEQDKKAMLGALGLTSMEGLLKDIPDEVLLRKPLDIPGGVSELELERSLAEKIQNSKNIGEYVSFLGGGIYDHFIPSVVDEIAQRGEFSTSYTPYQAEASQGVLQAFFEYQSLITELLKMEASNASMYDGASSLAEAAMMAGRITGKRNIFISKLVNPEYRKVLKTYLKHAGGDMVEIGYKDGLTDREELESRLNDETACVIIQSPNFFGCIENMREYSAIVHRNKALFIACVDPISLAILSPPGAYDADIAVAEGQSLGNPMYFGGGCLGIFTCRKKFVRGMPGRIVGLTEDKDKNPAFCLTLQTREQHIRREGATSNICSNQALYALRAAVYLGCVGKRGLREVANQCLQKSHYLKKKLKEISGVSVIEAPFFKEFIICCPVSAERINRKLIDKGFLGGVPIARDYPDMQDGLLICVTEKRTKEEMDKFVTAFKECVS